MKRRRVREAIVATSLVGAACTASSGVPSADLVLYNGRVITVDGSFTIAQSVAISGDRIIAVGSNASVRGLARAGAREIDLAGRAVIPGLMDNHLHGAGGGPGVDLSRARTLEEVYAALRERAGRTPRWRTDRVQQRLARGAAGRAAPAAPRRSRSRRARPPRRAGAWRTRIHRELGGAADAGGSTKRRQSPRAVASRAIQTDA